MEIALARGGRLSRIDHDPASPVIALLPEKFVQDRKRLRAVRTRDDQNFGERNVSPRVRRTIDAECFVVTGSGRYHAQPSVVIDIRSEEHTSELQSRLH